MIVLSPSQIRSAWSLALLHNDLALGTDLAVKKSHLEDFIPQSFIPTIGQDIPSKEGLFIVRHIGKIQKNHQIPWLLCVQKKRSVRRLPPTHTLFDQERCSQPVQPQPLVLNRFKNRRTVRSRMAHFNALAQSCCVLYSHLGDIDVCDTQGQKLSLIGPEAIFKAYLLHKRLIAQPSFYIAPENKNSHLGIDGMPFDLSVQFLNLKNKLIASAQSALNPSKDASCAQLHYSAQTQN